MKPLPMAVQQAFPCAPDRLPERPWWRRAGGQYRRRDMTELARPYNEGLTVEYDAKNPLPHPGYRAGQVWAAESSQSTVLLAVAFDSAWVAVAGKGVVLVMLDSLAHMYPYLMADPSCPHLAPWSPAEAE